MLNAMQKQAFRPAFFVVADANLAQIFFKEKYKSIVNGKKLREKHAMFAAVFFTWAHLYGFFKVFFSRMVRQKTHFVKHVYHFNTSLTCRLECPIWVETGLG